jgi:integration host factor subunit alpha
MGRPASTVGERLTNRHHKPLTRADLVANLRERVGLSARDASSILDSTLRQIGDALVAGHPVNIPELGRFQVKITPSRPGRNPKTGEPVPIPARRRLMLSMSRKLRAKMRANLLPPPASKPSSRLALAQAPEIIAPDSAASENAAPERPAPGQAKPGQPAPGKPRPKAKSGQAPRGPAKNRAPRGSEGP